MLTQTKAVRPHVIDPLAVARACQEISAHTTAEDILEVAGRAALALTDANHCVIRAIKPDGAPWLEVAFARQGDAIIAREPTATCELVLPIAHQGQHRGVLALDALDGDGLAPLLAQIAIALGHALLYTDLESLVVREMQTSVEREEAMQLVLDSMHDGLLVCELDGRASPIYSRSMRAIFGEPGERTLAEYLGGGSPDLQFAFEFGWYQLVGDVLPFELAASQMPAQLRHGECTYQLAYQRVERDGVLARVAVSVRDVTAEIAARRAHELAHELAAVVRSMMADREGFNSFLDETEQMLADIGTSGLDHARWIHTLKGNTGMFGFRWFARRCHELEDELATGAPFDDARAERLRQQWQHSLEAVRPFFGSRNTDDITVARDELAAQILRMRDAGVARELLDELDRWRLEPVGPCLERLARQAERIALAQGKQLAVRIEGGRVRFSDDRMRRLLAPLVHAVRNAVDHGLEAPPERAAAGKPVQGELTLACRSHATEFVIEVRDDGCGIDWQRVHAKATALGLATATQADLVEALFADGMSTAAEVTDVSGRGVGLGALRETCRALGGSVELASEPGRGTQLRCRIPFVP